MRRFAMLCCLFVALPSVALADDVIEYFDDAGKSQIARGNIREETRQQVAIESARGKVSVPVNQIESIKYDGQPAQLTNVRSMLDRGLYTEALNEYKEIGASLPQDQPLLQAAVAYGMFVAQAQLAIADPTKSDEALKWYTEHGEKFSDSRHYYPMQELLGRVYLARGDFDNAAKAFGTLKDVDWAGFKEKGTVYQGLAALRKGDYADAKLSFDSVIGTTGTDRESQKQKFTAQVYLGEVYVKTNKAAEAEKLLRASLKEIPKEEGFVKALGHNALGDALRALKKEKEAMLEGYMWVYTIYNKYPEQMARSLFNLSQIFPQVGNPERGQEMAARLTAEYPTTEWAKKLGKPTGG